MERIDTQILVQPLTGNHSLRRAGQGLEQVTGEIGRHVIEGAGAGLIRIAQPQPDQRQILGVVLGLADLAFRLDVSLDRDVHAAVAHLFPFEPILTDVAAGSDLDLLRAQAAIFQALDAGDGRAARQQGLAQRIPGRLLASIGLVATENGGAALGLDDLGPGRQADQQQG
ncbi:hypothetical protein D3C78_1073870 [compost metagenome]